jgi:dipeptidase E
MTGRAEEDRDLSTNEPVRTIVAMGGNDFGPPDNLLVDDHVIALARAQRGRDRPRVCFVPTASGDSREYLVSFYAAFARRSEACHLGLFDRTIDDLERFVLDQDVVIVGGGNTANMLAIWRVHGLDRILARAWTEGVVLAGTSAGANCWFEGSTTDSFGGLAALADGLGFLSGSFSPHYDGEPLRRPTYRQLIGEGTLPSGYAADDGAAIVFRGTEPVEAVASRPGAHAYRVVRGPDGAIETELPTRYLG